MKKKVTDVVRELAEPYCAELGLELWDVLFVKEGPDWKLRLIIDKEGGVCIEDCVDLSHAIDAPLDELDPIDESYSLQVQSPGIERELTRDSHLDRYTDKKVIVRSQKAVNGVKEHRGILKSYNAETVVIAENGEDVSFERKLVSRINADDDDI